MNLAGTTSWLTLQKARTPAHAFGFDLGQFAQEVGLGFGHVNV